MALPADYDFIRYLAAKKSVDDRCLNRQVLSSLAEALPTCSSERPLRVLEIAAGIGGMVERLWDEGLLRHAVYTAFDLDPAHIEAAGRRLEGLDPPLELHLEAIGLDEFIAREQGAQTWDLVVAHAFLDLVDVPSTLPGLVSLLQPGGLLYLTSNFDGATILLPEIDPIFDAEVESLYHRTMDERRVGGKPSGDSRCGRHLFGHLRCAGIEILAAGSSDWVVLAGGDGYTKDEAYFLHFILHTIEGAVGALPQIDGGRLESWIRQRHAQVEAGTLVYIAHQLDLLARLGERPG